jgi:hypothetical protein
MGRRTWVWVGPRTPTAAGAAIALVVSAACGDPDSLRQSLQVGTVSVTVSVDDGVHRFCPEGSMSCVFVGEGWDYDARIVRSGDADGRVLVVLAEGLGVSDPGGTTYAYERTTVDGIVWQVGVSETALPASAGNHRFDLVDRASGRSVSTVTLTRDDDGS